MTYTQSVYDADAFSTQQRNYYCTAALTQYIRNLARTPVHTEAEQTTMYNYGRAHNKYAYGAKGNDPQGLAAMLNNYSAGGVTTWHVVRKTSLRSMLTVIAQRMRATNLPSVIFVSGGGHVWVMDGYVANVDPNNGTPTVSKARVSGPLWPTQKYKLGYYELPPGTWLTTSKLAFPFFKYSEYLAFGDHKSVVWQGYFVAVVP